MVHDFTAQALPAGRLYPHPVLSEVAQGAAQPDDSITSSEPTKCRSACDRIHGCGFSLSAGFAYLEGRWSLGASMHWATGR